MSPNIMFKSILTNSMQNSILEPNIRTTYVVIDNSILFAPLYKQITDAYITNNI